MARRQSRALTDAAATRARSAGHGSSPVVAACSLGHSTGYVLAHRLPCMLAQAAAACSLRGPEATRARPRRMLTARMLPCCPHRHMCPIVCGCLVGREAGRRMRPASCAVGREAEEREERGRDKKREKK